jgi:predicted membrane channel-forming protein YqfA (hemolysin III family)
MTAFRDWLLFTFGYSKLAWAFVACVLYLIGSLVYAAGVEKGRRETR